MFGGKLVKVPESQPQANQRFNKPPECLTISLFQPYTSTIWSVHSGFGMNTPFSIQFLCSGQVLILLTFLMRFWLWGYILPPRLFLYQPCNSPACRVNPVHRQSDSK